MSFIHQSTRFIAPFFRQIYDQLLPPTCILCGDAAKSALNLCSACHDDLPILPESCRRCAKFLVSINTTSACGACLSEPPPFEQTFALFPYEFPIIQLIHQLKFKHDLSVARTLSRLMLNKIVTTWYADQRLPDLIIPIPLHPLRLRERGFNQAVEIARPLAKKLRLPMDIRNIVRHKNTAAQSRLAKNEREGNTANAFHTHTDFTGIQIAVLDDVVTTAQTVTEFCSLLTRHGAKSIHVWCCARRG